MTLNENDDARTTNYLYLFMSHVKDEQHAVIESNLISEMTGSSMTASAMHELFFRY